MTVNAPASTQVETGDGHLDVQQQILLRSQLVELAAQHRVWIAEHQSTLDGSETSDSSPEVIEAVRVEFTRMNETLAEFEKAVARVDTGTYGACETCAEPIPVERLEVIPHTTHCVRCPLPGSTFLG